jgi:hypothetical protein
MTSIAHASIPADDPKHVAEVLAEILSGEAMPFPPAGDDAWMAWSGDGNTEIEISRRGLVVTHGDEQAEWLPDAVSRRLSDVHLAVCVERPAAEILAIAKSAGWPARACDRGGGIFQLTEVWVEGAFLIEVLDPAQTARYREVVTPENWKRYLPIMQAA